MANRRDERHNPAPQEVSGRGIHRPRPATWKLVAKFKPEYREALEAGSKGYIYPLSGNYNCGNFTKLGQAEQSKATHESRDGFPSPSIYDFVIIRA